MIDVSGRHPSLQDAVRLLDSQHLSDDLKPVAQVIENAASQLLALLPDGPKLTEALNWLKTAKDSAVGHAVIAWLDAQNGTPAVTLQPGETVTVDTTTGSA